MDEIFSLEGGRPTKTRVAEQYQGKILKGLWKKHFFQPGFIAQNLRNELKLGNPKSQKTKDIIKQKMKTTESPLEFASLLAHEITMETYKRKANKGDRTGEWIVFAKHQGRNYYLSLALHDEDDTEVLKRILSEGPVQFPFLKGLELHPEDHN